jgi:Calcineurin-like phosphoesterase
MNWRRRAFLAAPFALAGRAQTVPDDFPGVSRIVAVGDVHGDKDAFAAVLRMAEVVDGQDKWVGGRAHLVQIGDISARGPQTREAFDLLMRLEKEAQAAGGRVHALIGNHEVGIMSGDLRNVVAAEYEAFKGAGSEERIRLEYEKELESRKRAGRYPATEADLEYFKKSWFERHPPGFVEHREAFSPSGPYGSWIRTHNAVIRINDTLFLHGGISPKYVARTRASLNQAIRKELADPENLLPGLGTDPLGPVWYRGFAEEEEGPLEAHLKKVLAFHGVRRIVIGHTVTRSAILPRFGGRVVNIDIGLSRFYGRPPACLVLEGNIAFVLHKGTKVALPGPGELVSYLKAVEAADGQPSPVTKLLEAKK